MLDQTLESISGCSETQAILSQSWLYSTFPFVISCLEAFYLKHGDILHLSIANTAFVVQRCLHQRGCQLKQFLLLLALWPWPGSWDRGSSQMVLLIDITDTLWIFLFRKDFVRHIWTLKSELEHVKKDSCSVSSNCWFYVCGSHDLPFMSPSVMLWSRSSVDGLHIAVAAAFISLFIIVGGGI